MHWYLTHGWSIEHGHEGVAPRTRGEPSTAVTFGHAPSALLHVLPEIRVRASLEDCGWLSHKPILT
jgi:hypothetical protein